MASRTIGILGLGIFGQSVLKTLQDQDVDIIAIDDHEDVINQYESMITTGIVGDITEMDLLDAADIGNCDTVVIATGENLESSVLAVMHCKALGVEHVIAKVKNEVTKEVLEKIGADLVILPEVEAFRTWLSERSTISILSAIEMRKTNRFIFRLVPTLSGLKGCV